MSIKIDDAKQSESAFRQLFPEIPANAKSFKAFWREDKNPSASFVKMESGTWIIKDFESGKAYDLFAALEEFKGLTFKQSIDLIAAQFPQYASQPEKSPEEWAKRRNISFDKLEIQNQEIIYKYHHWKTGAYVGSKIRRIGANLPKSKRFSCVDGLTLTDNFYHANLGPSKRLYILAGEGDCLAMSQRVSDPCVGISGEEPRPPLRLVDCINHYQFEEIFIYYDNPLYEPGKAKNQNLLAKELIKLDSVNLVFGADWQGIYYKDIGEASGAGVDAFLKAKESVKRLEYKAVDEDKELILEALKPKQHDIDIYEFIPNQIADCLTEIARLNDLNFPPFAVLNVFLSTVAGLLGTNSTVEYRGTKKHSVLWNANIFDVGVGKSPITEDGVLKPLLDWQEIYHDEYKQELERYNIEQKKWKKKDEAFTPRKMPVHKHIVLKKGTPEASIRAYYNNQQGLIIFHDELKAFFKSFNQYKKSGGDDRDVWLSIASGAGISIIRVDETQNIYTPKSAISLVGNIQFDTLQNLINADNDTGDGLWSRFLFFNGNGFKFSERVFNREKPRLGILSDLYSRLKTGRGKLNNYVFENYQVCDEVSLYFQRLINSNTGILRGYYAKQFHKFLILCMVLQSLQGDLVISNQTALCAKKLIQIYEWQALMVFQPASKEVTLYQKILELPEITIREMARKHYVRGKPEGIKVLKEMQSLGLGTIQTNPRGAVSFERN